MLIGWNLEVLMNKSLRKKERLNHGDAQKKILLAVGMV